MPKTQSSFCPSCGAEIKKADQRYCQECGTTLPQTNGRNVPALQPSNSGSLPLARGRSDHIFGLVPDTLKNRLMLYSGGAVVAVFALYILLGVIVHTLEAILPILVVLAVAYFGFQFWLRSRKP
jgi:hypothetical protein